ncbi:uncharacterized protein LOC127809559 [Diospyros lotus]|uniref:uncharacterized protein LOC127809559 n=1 Tax=Diospyros lotus TaxID=55363 RepID=UPI00225760A6|nr:uncharacterized protein LOC127809559 [Diospyros lotus]XP_052204392.1 uncharacterized protein LOC127809559 [Diospyros lotus]XP_052204393.1 uncharacterized protein LOC127809559 [Diospyros lotus]
MKRKRGCDKCKPKLAHAVGSTDRFLNTVNPNVQDHSAFYDTEFDSRIGTEIRKPNNNGCGEQAAYLPRKARSIMTRATRGSSSHTKQIGNMELMQGGSTLLKKLKGPQLFQDPEYKEQELKAALAVIRKVMTMDAAEPFNTPVDPIALGISDYFGIIDTPMDFGTICSNIENGVKYKNSKDIFQDVQCIWDNCSMYNKKGQYILVLMKRVKKNFTKYWSEAGLYRGQHQEINGHSHVPSIDSTMGCSTHGHRSSLETMADYAGDQQQDQMDLSPSHLSRGCVMLHQHQRRPCQCHLDSSQQQTFHPQAGRDGGGAGDLHLSHTEAAKWNQRGHGLTGLSQSQLHQHQPSLNCSQPCQTQQGSYQCQTSSGQSQPRLPRVTTYFTIAEAMGGHTYSKHGCPTCFMLDYPPHLNPVRSGVNQPQLHQHQASSYLQAPQTARRPCLFRPKFVEPQLPQPHVGKSFASTAPPEESVMMSNIRESRCPVGPMTDYANHEQQDHATPSQKLQLLGSNSLSHQPEQGTYQFQLSSSQPQPSHPQIGTYMGSAGSSNIKKNTRGPTRCLKIWNREGKVSVATNELGQPIGVGVPKLTNFLGTIARNGHIAPLNYVDWRALPDENKEMMWQQVQAKFEIDPKSRRWVLKSLGKKWKDWKAHLKMYHYNTHETDEERLADCDERVLPGQWQILVSFWNSRAAKDRSIANKASRANQKITHIRGRMSSAKIREEQSQLHEQAAPQQETTQNGSGEDDVFSQVMETDGPPGHMQTFGLGPSPTSMGSPKPLPAGAMRSVSEGNENVQDMMEKIMAMEQTYRQMATQMADMMSMMSNMLRNFPGKHGSPSEPSHVREVVDVSSSSE